MKKRCVDAAAHSKTGTAMGDAAWVLALGLPIAALLYLVIWDLRPYPFLGWVDDYRYVKSAWYLLQGDWLGPYDSTALVKRPFFPVLLAATSALGIPFDPFQVFFYLSGAGLFVFTLCRLGVPRRLCLPLLPVLGFLPTLYDADGSRVLRETVTVGLEFIVFSTALGLLVTPLNTSLRDFIRSRSGVLLALLYFLAAFHWGMREEGILLSGVLMPLLVLVALWRLDGTAVRRAVNAAVLCGGLSAAIASAYVFIASVNFYKYGVFLTNDLSEGEFPKVAGVLKSIQEGPDPQLLLNSEETRKLLEMSPKFHEIGELLERLQSSNVPLDYSHEMFFLRVTALQGKTLGSSAIQTQRYFRDLYHDVSSLCLRKMLNCAPNPARSIIPGYTWDQWSRMPAYAGRLAGWLMTTRNSGFDFLSRSYPGVEPIPTEVLQRFVEVTRQEPFGWDGKTTEFTLPGKLDAVLRQQDRRVLLGEVYSALSPVLYGLAAVGLLVGLPWAWKTRSYICIVAAATLGFHVLARVAAFSYLSAMDDGTVPVRLIRPAYPFGLGLAVLSVGIGISALLDRRTPRRNRSAGD